MKRRLEDEAEAIDNRLANFPIVKLPTDLIVKIFLESGFTIPELHTLCNLSTHMRAICNNRKIWDRIFMERIMESSKKEMKKANAKGQLPELLALIRTSPLFLEWVESATFCKEPFTRLAAFAYDKDLRKKKLPSILFLHKKKPYLKFEHSKTHGNSSILFLPEDDSTAVSDEDDLSENDKYWIKKYGMTLVENDYYEQLTYVVPHNKVIRLFCDLMDHGWNPHNGQEDDNDEEHVVPSLLQSCIVCKSTSNLQLCSGSCKQIYCSKECQLVHH